MTPTCPRCGIDHPAGVPACPAQRSRAPIAPTLLAEASPFAAAPRSTPPLPPPLAARAGAPPLPPSAGSPARARAFAPTVPAHALPPSALAGVPPAPPAAYAPATPPGGSPAALPPAAFSPSFSPAVSTPVPFLSVAGPPPAFAPAARTPLPAAGAPRASAPSLAPRASAPSVAPRATPPARPPSTPPRPFAATLAANPPQGAFGPPPGLPASIPPRVFTPPPPSAPARRGGGIGSTVLVLAGVAAFLGVTCVGSGVVLWLSRGSHAASAGTESPSAVPVAIAPVTPAPVGVMEDGASRLPVLDSPVRGPRDALVTIVEVADLQCPFSRRVQSSLDQLRAAYPNDVRVVFKHYPMPHHLRAVPAAELALEARAQQGDEGFWRAHDLLFREQRALGPAELETYAAMLGLDVLRVRLALEQGKHRARIAQDQALAEGVAARGTPTLFVNGHRVTGAQPYAAIQRVVEQELGRARAALAGGTPRGQLYGLLSSTLTEDEAAPGVRGLDALGGALGRLGLGGADSPDTVYAVTVPPAAPARGALTAPVTLQMFGDLECPFTRRSLATVRQLEQEYGGRIRVVWRNAPLDFHPNAGPAATAAMEVHTQAGPQAFWAFVERVLEQQGQLSRDALVALAAQVPGVDATRVRRAIEQGSHAAYVQADLAALQNAGISLATPIFLVNGRMVRGAQPIERFRATIDAALVASTGRRG